MPQDEDAPATPIGVLVQEDKRSGIAISTVAGRTQYPTGAVRFIMMASLMLGITLMSLDTTIISVATPKISTQFHALDDVGWYGAAYLMTLTAMTPIAANSYKYFHPKSVYLASIVIFEGIVRHRERLQVPIFPHREESKSCRETKTI